MSKAGVTWRICAKLDVRASECPTGLKSKRVAYILAMPALRTAELTALMAVCRHVSSCDSSPVAPGMLFCWARTNLVRVMQFESRECPSAMATTNWTCCVGDVSVSINTEVQPSLGSHDNYVRSGILETSRCLQTTEMQFCGLHDPRISEDENWIPPHVPIV